jgi:hypothetical protein
MECTWSICISCSSYHEWLWFVLNLTHLIFVYLIRFVELVRTMHQRWFLFRIFILHRITQGPAVWNLDYSNDVLLHSHTGMQALVVCYSRGHRFWTVTLTWRGKAPQPTHANVLGLGWSTTPQTIVAKTRARGKVIHLLPSLSKAPDSILKLLPSTLLCCWCLLLGPWRSQWGRLSMGRPQRPSTLAILHRQVDLSSMWSLIHQFPLWRWIITIHCSCCLSSFN